MNTKKMLPLFVLVPVVVVLGVALGVLNHADTEEEDTSIALCSLDADSVIAIAYKDASDGATLESALTTEIPPANQSGCTAVQPARW